MDVSDDVLEMVINHQKSLQPVELYRGLQQGKVRLVQFTPLIKRDASGYLAEDSVTPDGWGRFLIAIFDIWVREDINQISIQLFDNTLRQWCGRTALFECQTMTLQNTRCQACSLFQYYHGDCPAYREENGKGVLCTGYQAFFNHTAPHMRVMRDLLKQHRSPMELMAMLR